MIMRKHIRNGILAGLLAVVLAAGNCVPVVFAEEDSLREEIAVQENEGTDAAEYQEITDEDNTEKIPEESDEEDDEIESTEGISEEISSEAAGNASDEETEITAADREEENGRPERLPIEKVIENKEEITSSEESEKEADKKESESLDKVEEENIQFDILEKIQDTITSEEDTAEEILELPKHCSCGYVEENSLLHEWSCPVFQDVFTEMCDCGEESVKITAHEYECNAVVKAFAAICNETCGASENQAAAHRCAVRSRLFEMLCTCGCDSEDFSEHDAECGYYEYLLGSVNILYGTSLSFTANQNGTRLTHSSVKGWTYASGSKVFSSKYLGIKFVDGISAVNTWIDKGADVTSSEKNGFLELHPNNSESTTKNHFGALYSKVIYDGENWYDMKITVLNYTNSVTSLDGTKVTVHPGIKFSKKNIEYRVSQEVGGVRLKIEFLKSGTDISAKLNIRFQWRDIDDSQRYGFSVKDASGTSYGTVDQKYYFSENTFVNVLNTTVLGGDMEVLIGDEENIQDTTDRRTRVAYELGNCSRYYMTIGPVDNIGDTEHQKVYTTATYKNWEKAMKKGEYSFETDLYGNGHESEQVCMEDLIVTTDVTALIDTPAPVKTVSNDGVSWGTSNTLTATDSEYYYRVEQRIPWQDTGYRYEHFFIRDSLPVGVDYIELTNIKDEGGRDKSSLFTVDALNDELTMTAKNPSDGDFAGHYYYFVFKVRMDPTEMMPVYNGNKAVYSVSNMASAVYNHPYSQIKTNVTNSVTTTVSVTRPTPENPQKGFKGKNGLTTYTTSSRSEEIVFSIFQKIPDYESAWEPCDITVSDALESCLEYKRYSVKLNENTLSGWSVTRNGQTINISGNNQKSYSGKTLRFDIVCGLKKGYDLLPYQKIENGSVIASIPNKAKVKFVYSHASGTAIEKNTNTVYVKIRENAVNLIVEKTDADTGNFIPNAVFTVYEWSGTGYNINRGNMTCDKSNQVYRMDHLVRTASNSGKFKVAETLTPTGYVGSWEKEFTISDSSSGGTPNMSYKAVNSTPRGTITVYKKNEIGNFLAGSVFEIRAKKNITSPQGIVLVKAGTVVDTIKTGAGGKAVSKELYMGTYTVTEKKAPAGYAIHTVPKEITLSYQNKNTIKINQELTFVDSIAVVHLRLTKEIDAEDIVWAHGNPTFTFKVKGEDLYGNTHTYHETVEFTEDNSVSKGKITLTADIPVLSGIYTVEEEKTMRYELKGVHSIENGKAEGKILVVFDLSKGVDGKAVFYNMKTTDERQSHTIFIRNVIKEK